MEIKHLDHLNKFIKFNRFVLDVPVAPSVTGRVTFNNVELYEPGKRTSTGIILQDEIFRVPVGYVSSEVL